MKRCEVDYMEEKMEAKVILMKCPETKKVYGVRIEKYEGDWYRTWAFPLDSRKAAHEGYDREKITGNLYPADEYPGCPYCKSVKFITCGTCGKLSCDSGKKVVQCPWCGTRGRIMTIEKEIEFGVGDM